MTYHVPVLLEESVEGLLLQPNGIYVDATFGGGGHSKHILQKLGAKGHLYGFDQDEDVLPNLISENEHFTFVHHNFRFLKRFLRLHRVREVDGILADLGVSSHQLDSAERGFSYRFDAELDMRMNRKDGPTAADVLNTYTAEQLQSILSRYGELRNARTLSKALVDGRRQSAYKRIGDLLLVAQPHIRGHRARYLSQLFQALRIEVNDEMGALRTFLEDGLELLKPGGRMVIITYHSLEDRLVKHFFKTGNFEGELIKDFYGNIQRPFRIVTKKALLPSEREIQENPRARSAKLRIAEKI
ncbi:MAG: 16S rRNA (cytosine(1402)-N(4))-methyltransferase RsmH [Bacteroidota bacterium]